MVCTAVRCARGPVTDKSAPGRDIPHPALSRYDTLRLRRVASGGVGVLIRTPGAPPQTPYRAQGDPMTG
ncbi:hypothetical protein GCM10010388_43630 [Streptomyces mauvecolor]